MDKYNCTKINKKNKKEPKVNIRGPNTDFAQNIKVFLFWLTFHQNPNNLKFGIFFSPPLHLFMFYLFYHKKSLNKITLQIIIEMTIFCSVFCHLKHDFARAKKVENNYCFSY